MKTILLCLAAASLIAAEPQNELWRASRATPRVVYGYPVDISAVQKWSGKGERPLPGWKRITGRIVKDYANRWEMEVTIDGEQSRIILNNPPVAALKEFTNLKQQHAALQEELRASTAAASAASDNAVEARADLRAAPIGTTNPRLRVQKRTEENFDGALAGARAANQEESYASTRASRASEALRQFDSRGYRLDGEFSFIGWAVKTKEVWPHGSLLVYDHGTYR